MSPAEQQRAWIGEALTTALGRALTGDVSAVPMCARLLDLKAATLGVRR